MHRLSRKVMCELVTNHLFAWLPAFMAWSSQCLLIVLCVTQIWIRNSLALDTATCIISGALPDPNSNMAIGYYNESIYMMYALHSSVFSRGHGLMDTLSSFMNSSEADIKRNI